jgi:hypothetical protein
MLKKFFSLPAFSFSKVPCSDNQFNSLKNEFGKFLARMCVAGFQSSKQL